MAFKKSVVISKIVIPALVLSLVSPIIPNSKAEAAANPKIASEIKNYSQDHFSFEDNGEKYDVTTAEYENKRVVIIKGKEGFQKFTTNKNTGNISVESDYLKKSEIKENEVITNEVASSITDEKLPEPVAPIPATELPTNNVSSSSNVSINSITGSWAWSSWYNKTVTVADKATIIIVTGAILSKIPYIGWVASAMASILINYKMKTGYFKVRAGTALDTDPNYVWTKKIVNLYSNSARTKLRKSETSNPYQVRVY
ncbi:hypothetical protein C2I17_20370 [Niallia circulans]|uniref:hypothetical protein n=1 Tax=Niallia circulans TaxID=1397 RepID=UPI00201DF0F1|nr:hypothetical protein [Niallia circulans]UQZ76708.1 hypothetical protein C2I17_20370 [Niallia circulans]